MIEKLEDCEFVLVLPNAMLGEVGEELKEDVQAIIRSLADVGWWPVDFGENDGHNTELWFAPTDGKMDVRKQAEHFIKVNGEV